MFLWNVLQQNFYNFLPELSEFGFWLEGLRLAIKSKFSRDFLEISLFPKIRLKSFASRESTSTFTLW